MSNRVWRPAAIGVLLVALAARLVALNDLVIFGDSAASVYFAMQEWTQIAPATAVDSHPPGYYYLLRLSLEVFGWHETGARMASIVPGVLLVAVVLAAARRLADPRVGLVVGLLAALSPPLVIYSRQPRMYALVALLALALLALASQPGRSLRREIALVAISCAALMTHYFSALVVAAAAVVAVASRLPAAARRPSGSRCSLLTSWRRVRTVASDLGRTVWPFVAATALWLPWLAYALGESLRHTERTIVGVPPQPTLLHFFGSLAVAISIGTFVPLLPSMALAAAWWLVACGVALAARRWLSWPCLAFGVIAAGAAAIYLVQPAFARPRFFLALVPLALLSLAAPLGALGVRLAASAAGVLAAVEIAAIVLTAPVERGTLELEAVRLGEALAGVRPNDVVILQPWWQAGYLRTRLDPIPGLVAMRDLSEPSWPALLDQRRDVWLVFTGVGRRDPAYPLEEWLDRRAYRVDEQTFGVLRVVRYTVSPDAPLPEPVVFPNGLVLAAAPAVREVQAGDPLPVLVRWDATRPVEERVVFFLHLRRQDGTGWAGRDEEPEAGARRDGRWEEGETVLDRRGLLVPRWTPPGDYRLVAGLYGRSDGNRLGGELDLGTVRVIRATAVGSPRAVLAESLELMSVRLALPNPGAAQRTTIETVDGPQTLVTPIAARSGETLSVELAWRATGPVAPVTVSVRVLDAGGRVVVERVGPPAGPADPQERWTPGGLATGRFDLVLPFDLPHGRYRLGVGLVPADGGHSAVTVRETHHLAWLAIANAD